MQNGKGDKPRPLTVPRKEFDKNWDLAFKAQKGKSESEDKLDLNQKSNNQNFRKEK